MALTNTQQCLGARNGISNHGGSCNTHRSDRNGNRGNSRFANSSSIGEIKRQSQFSPFNHKRRTSIYPAHKDSQSNTVPLLRQVL